MDSKRMVLEEFAMDFDLSRIRYLALPEKFKLVNHIKLICTEAAIARTQGVKGLESSKNYTVNKTYNLFAMLLIHGVTYETLKEIVRNYAQNFEKSDTYYSQIAVLGMGVMMIDKEFSPDAIMNFLMHLLGEEFLSENLKYPGYMTAEEAARFDFASQIHYKPFEGNLRRVKYDLLALLRIRDTRGLDDVKAIINTSYGDQKLKLYFNMLAVSAPEVMEYLYDDMKETALTEDRLKVYGAYALLKGFDVFSTHYMFNSVIGKYSRYDKASGEIEQELNVRLAEILSKAQ